MIPYQQTLFGFHDLTRIHGSALYRALIPAITSTMFLWVLDVPIGAPRPTVGEDGELDEYPLMWHPYALGALIVFISYLLTFRLNFAYGRYWEGATAVHQMVSKWVDCAITLASFHYQSDQFRDIRPPTFGGNPNARRRKGDVGGGRGRENDLAYKNYVKSSRILKQEEDRNSFSNKLRRVLGLTARKKKKPELRTSEKGKPIFLAPEEEREQQEQIYYSDDEYTHSMSGRKIPVPLRFQEKFVKATTKISLMMGSSTAYTVGSGDADGAENEDVCCVIDNNPSSRVLREYKIPKPSLFLEEMAHLFSLLSAVAMATLRNDNPCAELPLTEYVPGKPMPPVDPDNLEQAVQEEYNQGNVWRKWFNFLFGISRTEQQRTLYNAARPFAVLGGVSDQEVQLLFQANGPYAKVSLVTMWLQEVMTREYLSGSTGSVADPIISRLYQYLSDGVLGYNQARKIAYIPFPYPHSQITSSFSFVMVFFFPILYLSFVSNEALMYVLNFTTTLCFLGLHQVAMELEHPFQNAPNDLPLVTHQAQFNEALVTVYAGFHPDAWFEVVKSTRAGSTQSSTISGSKHCSSIFSGSLDMISEAIGEESSAEDGGVSFHAVFNE